MPLVSIIVPAYNVEQFVKKTLDSIRKQTFSDYEVIVINDGSTDMTKEILKEFCEMDSRFNVIDQENQGVSAARNNGLRMAKGKYVVFYDADDFIPRSALEKMVYTAESKGADLVIGRLKINRLEGSNTSKATIRLSRKNIISKTDTDLLWNFSICNKLFRKQIADDNNLFFDESLAITEDGAFCILFIQKSKSICGCDAVAYEYEKRPFWEGASITQNKSSKLLQNTYSAFKDVEKMVMTATSLDNLQVPNETDNKGKYNQEICDRLMFQSTLYKRFVKSDILANQYRGTWLYEEDPAAFLSEIIAECRENMFPDMWEQLVEQSFDVKLNDGIQTWEEIAYKPTVTIVLSDKIETSDVNGILKSCYRQEMPLFEVLVCKNLESNVGDEYKAKLNLSFIEDMSNLHLNVKGDYVLILEDNVWLMRDTFREMLKVFESSDLAQCVSVPVKKLENDKFIECDMDKRGALRSNKLYRAGFSAYEDFSALNLFEEVCEESFMMQGIV